MIMLNGGDSVYNIESDITKTGIFSMVASCLRSSSSLVKEKLKAKHQL